MNDHRSLGAPPTLWSAASQPCGLVGLPPDAAVQQQPQPVVGEVAEAVADPLVLLISRLIASVSPLEQLAVSARPGSRPPGVHRAGQPRQLGHLDGVAPAIEQLQRGPSRGRVGGGRGRTGASPQPCPWKTGRAARPRGDPKSAVSGDGARLRPRADSTARRSEAKWAGSWREAVGAISRRRGWASVARGAARSRRQPGRISLSVDGEANRCVSTLVAVHER